MLTDSRWRRGTGGDFSDPEAFRPEGSRLASRLMWQEDQALPGHRKPYSDPLSTTPVFTWAMGVKRGLMDYRAGQEEERIFILKCLEIIHVAAGRRCALSAL